MELKQGPNSRHIHTGFSGIAGKYVYCPPFTQPQGIQKEMTWRVFNKSAFYEMEIQRWVAEKKEKKIYFLIFCPL